MDNRIFNVNGKSDEQMLMALQLVFKQSFSTCTGWSEHAEKGMILHWTDSPGIHRLPSPMTAEEILPLVKSWFKSDMAKTVLSKCDGWDSDCDHDGHNSVGWRVYCEDWGKVNGEWTAMCAIKPAYMWHGK